jgi:hypothetical protein
MSFPLLGSPKIQFFDSSGSPLSSGTLAVLDPADDTNKASYPTADDADAATNANVNPVVLDARGEPPNGLFGRDGEDYKLTLKDSTGTTIWTADDVKIPNFISNTSVTRGAGLAKVNIKGTEPLAVITTSTWTRGAHATLRDFTGTTTAADALQLLETLVDDLIENGALKQ